MKFNLDDVRDRFHEAGRERDDIAARAEPLRQQRNDLRQQMDTLRVQAKAIGEQIKAIEQPIYELDNERSMLSRILKRKVGAPKEVI